MLVRQSVEQWKRGLGTLIVKVLCQHLQVTIAESRHARARREVKVTQHLTKLNLDVFERAIILKVAR